VTENTKTSAPAGYLHGDISGELKAAGYMPYKDQLEAKKSWYAGSWQKRVDEKYFINVDLLHSPEAPACMRYGFQFKAQFETKTNMTFNIEPIPGREKSLEEIEAFFEAMWQNLDCLPIDRYATEVKNDDCKADVAALSP